MTANKQIDIITIAEDARTAKTFLRAIDHKLRVKILEILHENGKITVTDLWIKLRVEQSVASQHLAILRRAGIVGTDREGKFIHYSIQYEYVNMMAGFIANLCEELPEARMVTMAKAA